MRDVLRRLTEALESGREVAIRQVEATRGSTPRESGAAMLQDPGRGQVGTPGGGCVGAEETRRAAGRMGRAHLHGFVLDPAQPGPTA